jgi:hypothetical protein
MRSLHPRCLEFVGSKVQELIRQGISVYLTNSQSINNKYSGLFNSHTKTLKVAMGQPDEYSMYTFLHEYAHYLQFMDKPDLWKQLYKEGTETYARWLNREITLSKAEIETAFRNVLALEHDAEVTAVSMVSMHNLPLNINTMSRRANCNLLFYSWTRINRVWGSGHCGISDEDLELCLPAIIPPLDYFTDMKNTKALMKNAGIKL